MSRNGSGVYSLPAGNPVTTGTTISSTWANTTLSDIATALTQSIAYNGVTTPIANLPMGGYKLTGLGVATTSGDALSYGNAITASSIVGTSVTDSGLTSGRVTYASTGGLLADSASLTFDGTNLGIANINGATLSLKTGGTAAVTVDASQNVGIGTSSPSQKLDIVGTSRYTFNVSNSYALLTSVNAAASAFVDSYYNASQHIWQGSGTERMRIDSSGNVGIGTSSPYTRLDLKPATDVSQLYLVQNNTNDGWKLHADSAVGAIAFKRSVAGTDTERMRIDSSGNVLVGTTSAGTTRKLLVDSAGSGWEVARFQQASANNSPALIEFWNQSQNYLWAVGCGNAASDSNFTFRYGGTQKANINSSSGAYTATSDARVKENIVDYSNALSSVLSLRPVTYNFIDDENKENQIGLIAQEVLDVIPEVVGKPANEDGYYGLNYAGLTPILIKAIQEQQAIITQLQADVAALKNGNTLSV